MKQRSAVLVYLSVLMTSGLMSFYWLPRIASEFLQQATPTEAARRLRAARTAYVAATILWVVTLLIVAAVHLWVEPQTLFAYFFKPMFFAALGVTIGLFICQGLLVHRFSVLVGRGRARTSLVGAVLLSVLWQFSVFRMQSEANAVSA